MGSLGRINHCPTVYSMSAPTPQSPHQAFIQAQLPAWITQAPANLLKDLRESLVSSNQSRHDIKALLDELKNPQDFARPLLRAALRSRFFGLLDDENAVLIREWKHHHLLGLIKNHAKTTRQTLLEAALQNFEAPEAQNGGMETGTGLYNITRTGDVLTQASATTFAEMCRTLDLGGQYLKHITQVLEPTAAAGATRTAAQVLAQLRTHERHAFGVALHIAYMKREFTSRQHLQLHSLQRTGNHTELKRYHLTISGVVLATVLVIEAPTIGIPVLLYVPEDPQATFRRHNSMEDLQSSLAERLENPDYLAFFRRLAPLQYQQTLFKTRPAWVDYLSITTPGRHHRASLENPLTRTPIPRDVFRSMAHQRIAQIKSDARTLAVPTADADLMSRQKRLQGYIDLGKSLLFFAASFIPIVGQVMLAVTAAQLISTVYEGFSAWSRGDSNEALNDLLDVVDNVALAAATAGAIKTVGFSARLIKVQLRNKSWRLWNPDLTPYRQPTTLPSGLAADARGVYHHEQQQYLKLDDQVHAVQRHPDGDQWQLVHPTDPHAYAPPLLNNSVGGWRAEHEDPQGWDDLKLIKRLGPDAANITQRSVAPILLLGGVDSISLRQTYQEMVRPPPQLRDTVKHFNLEQEISDFGVDRAEGKSVTPYSPFIQFHLVCSLPEWPQGYRLKVIDEQQNVVLSHGSGPTDIRVPTSRFRNGELLHVLEQQLPQADFNKLLPSPYIDYFTKQENLAVRLQAQVETQKQQLLSLLLEPTEKPLTPVEKELRALTPGLPKSYLEEMETTLSPEQRQALLEDKRLPPQQRWEAGEYLEARRALRASQGLYLDATRGPESVPLALYSLEQVPGWPGSRRIEVYADSNSGALLGSIGSALESARHILIRQGERYTVQDTEGAQLHPPTDLFSALEHTLSGSERQTLLSRSNGSLKQAILQSSSRLLARPPALRTLPAPLTLPVSYPIDPLFAEPATPDGLTVRPDDTYQARPSADGHYRYYILENDRYFRVKNETLGWQLIDARSPYRAYRPYLRRRLDGGWEIDPATGALPGGMLRTPTLDDLHMDSSDEYESAHSSEYESAEEGTVRTLYTIQEMRQMHSDKGYQYNQNYLRIYDRANNGRYPLRDETGRPMRVRFIQRRGLSLTSQETFSKDLVMPYLQWEGYQHVARLYEEKLEVMPFTADYQKFPEEAALIGQAMVRSRKPIKKGEPLGVYGGELLPSDTAMYRKDPYLIPVVPQPRMLTRYHPLLSGDNALSRINTILEYEAGQPVRQAATGYNVEAARFNVDTQVGTGPLRRLFITALFASEDIPAAAELRWNYQYDEAGIKLHFSTQP